MTEARLAGAWAAYDDSCEYGAPPFNPPERYPELRPLADAPLDPSNSVYTFVRACLARLDERAFGTPEWNPLGALIRPGDRVVIKPNLVMHDRGPDDGRVLRTHGAVVRCLLDYAAIALGGRGALVVADAPIQGADFASVVRQTGLDAIQLLYRQRAGIDVAVTDLRSVTVSIDEASNFVMRDDRAVGDPLGSTTFDLGDGSALASLPGASRFAVGDYNQKMTAARHEGGRHEYTVANTVLHADVVLNVAKLKTHKKAGITGAMKNVVGTVTDKSCLPHYREGGAPAGDEYPPTFFNAVVARGRRAMQSRVPLPLWRMMRRAALGATSVLERRRPGLQGLIGGGWIGNDTVWRPVHDLQKILAFGTRSGTLANMASRRVHHFIDGIVAGQGEGPLESTPVRVGLFLHGQDPLALDMLAAVLMGFDPERVPLFGPFTSRPAWQRAFLDAVSIDERLRARLDSAGHFAFSAPRGWRPLDSSVDRHLLSSLSVR